MPMSGEQVNPAFGLRSKTGLQGCLLLVSERGVVATSEEAVDVGLGVPVFVAVTGVAEEAVVA